MEHMLVHSKHFDTEKSRHLSLDEFSLPELRILLEKQTRLLSSPQILRQLPDRGERIKQYISSVERAIADRESYEAAIQAMGDLKIEETSPSVTSPLASPSAKSARNLSYNIDGDKLEKVKNKIASRPVSRGTQLLTGAEEQRVSDRDRERGRANREAEIKLGDFLGMFKVGTVKVASDLEETDHINIQDVRLRDNLREESDSDSEVSDQSKNSSGEGYGELGEDVDLFEDSLYHSTQ